MLPFGLIAARAKGSGGALWTAPELLFEKKWLIQALLGALILSS